MDSSKEKCLKLQEEISNENLNGNGKPTSENEDAVKKAFRIPLVLFEILKNIVTPELLSFRVVNSGWRDEATKVLLQESKCLIKFEFDYGLKTYQKVSKNSNFEEPAQEKSFPLKDLLEISKKSAKFPVSHFHFFEGSLRHFELQNFLNFYGKNVRHLELIDVSFSEDEESDNFSENGESEDSTPEVTFDPSFFRNLLVNQCPNLTCLQVNNLPEILDVKLFPSSLFGQLSLPNLKTLILNPMSDYIDPLGENHYGFLNEILNAAINLDRVTFTDNSQFKNLDNFNSFKRLNLIKEFSFHPCLIQIEILEKISKFPLQLESVEILMAERSLSMSAPRIANNPQVLNALTLIIESSKESLKKLKINDPADFGLVPGIKWPIEGFSKMKILTLRIFSTMHSRRIDTNFQQKVHSFNQLFPNLTTIHIQGHEGAQLKLPPSFGNIFNQDELLPNVKSIRITECSKPTEELFDCLSRVCPNVEDLTVTHIKKFSKFSTAIWKFKNLNSITIRLVVDGRKMAEWDAASLDQFQSLDTFFTGFSQRTVDRVLMNNHKSMSAEEVDKQRIYPSILNCQSLKSLHILFHDICPLIKQTSQTSTLLTHVSGWYGFSLLPELGVTMSIQSCGCLLEEVSSDEEIDSDLDNDSDYGGRTFRPQSGGYEDDIFYNEKLEKSLESMQADFPNVRVIPAYVHRLYLGLPIDN